MPHTLTPQQAKAVTLALTSRVMILTGGPGTGKTTTLRTILDRMEARRWHVSLCAPTGRAAQRMSEATGRPAETIHRLLRYHPDFGFTRNQQNPLKTDVVIVDEASILPRLVNYCKKQVDILVNACKNQNKCLPLHQK